MDQGSDPHPDYWSDYTSFQQVKHDLIKNYLGGWFPKLGFWAGRVLYIDTHAGRGRHHTGDPGSPLVALTTLLEHAARPRLLERSEFNFLFIERDQDNRSALEQEVAALRPLPSRVNVEISADDAFDRLSSLLVELKKEKARIAPAFVFVDPYGFKVPGRLLSDLMKAGERVELFVNVMWRELDMLIQQRPQSGTSHAGTLDEIFGTPDWRSLIVGPGVDDRLNQAAALLARTVGAGWWTSAVRMVTGGKATRYLLLHFTNHPAGRDLMKACSWSVFPDGRCVVRRSDRPDQPFLFEPEPDLAPLRKWVLDRLTGKPEHWEDLHAAIREDWWLDKHVNQVVKDLKKEGTIDADAIPGRRFSAAANPLLRLRRR